MDEKTLSSRRVFEGRLLKLDVMEVQLEGEQRGRREVIRHPGAAVVLARRPDGRFVFVRQFRKPMERELLEVIAGCLNPGEAPDACAAREVREETGYEVAALRPLGSAYTSPGFCDEMMHMFFAELKAGPETPMPDEDERVEPVVLGKNEVDAMMARGEIVDAKTLLLWLLSRKAGLV